MIWSSYDYPRVTREYKYIAEIFILLVVAFDNMEYGA